MNAVDTNILIYSLDAGEAIKQGKALALLGQLQAESVPCHLLWQVLSETINQLSRWRNQSAITDVKFHEHVQAIRGLFPILLPTVKTRDSALVLSLHYNLSHWDSMILGACREARINTLYTEDMGAPRMIDGIELINPFI
jgi:predicted nucleic acid-binding protein